LKLARIVVETGLDGKGIEPLRFFRRHSAINQPECKYAGMHMHFGILFNHPSWIMVMPNRNNWPPDIPGGAIEKRANLPKGRGAKFPV
jgi:hypothetical protein